MGRVLGKLLDLSGFWQEHPPCPRLAKIVMLYGREPRQRALPCMGSRYPTSRAGLYGGRKRQREREWGGKEVEQGREGWFGEGEVLGGLAGEERLVEVWGEKVTVECGDSEQPCWNDGMELGENQRRKGNGAGCFAAFCCKRTGVGEALGGDREIQLISTKLTIL